MDLTPGLIDTHAHLTYSGLCERIAEVLEHCREAGVERVITVGTTRADAVSAVALARRYPRKIHAACAFHPHHAGEADDESLQWMASLWRDPAVVAFGEMGLDYHYEFADRAVQRSVFEQQLALAQPLDRPLIIHSREALDDTIRILGEHGWIGRRVVFHCFTGTAEEAARIAEHGWRISFTGIVTFKKSAWLHAIARDYPADQLMIETDSPYLSPEPVRGKQPNEPAHVAHIAKFLARLRGVPEMELVSQTSLNARSFFRLT